MLKDRPWIRNHPGKCLTKAFAWQSKQTRSSIQGCVKALKGYLQGWRRSGAQKAKAVGAHYIFQSNRSMKENHSWCHTTSNWCFTGRAPQLGDISWSAFLSYQTAVLIAWPAACLSLPFWKAKTCCSSAEQGQMSPACHQHSISTSKWAAGPELTSISNYSGITPILLMDIIKEDQQTCSLSWLWFELIVLHQDYSPGGLCNIHSTFLCTLFLNMCKKIPLLYLSRKKSAVAFGICLHTSSTLSSGLVVVVVFAAVTEMYKIMQLSSI